MRWLTPAPKELPALQFSALITQEQQMKHTFYKFLKNIRTKQEPQEGAGRSAPRSGRLEGGVGTAPGRPACCTRSR